MTATRLCDADHIGGLLCWNSEAIPDDLHFSPRQHPDCNILVLGGAQQQHVKFQAMSTLGGGDGSDAFMLTPLMNVELTSGLKTLNWCGRHHQERIGTPLKHGLLAAGCEETIDFYDPIKILKTIRQSWDQKPDAGFNLTRDYGLVLRTKLGPNENLTKCDFDPVESFRIAAGTVQGIVSMYDLEANQKVSSIEVGTASNPTSITSLRWHPLTADVLGATTSNGCFHVLKGRNRRPLLTLQDPNKRRMVSGCVWFEMGKNAVVAYDEERPGGPAPVIQLWDLRHTAYPLREVSSHHKRGMVGLELSRADQRFFTTASRDGRCVTWAMTNQSIIPYSDIQLGEEVSSFAVFQTGPVASVALQTADKVTVHSIDASQCVEPGSAPLKVAPAWLHPHHNSVDFGFGGQLAWFSSQETDTVLASTVVADEAFVQSVDQFGSFLDRYDLVGLCADRTQESRAYDPYEARLWDAIAVHAVPAANRAAFMISRLGIDQDTISQQIASYLGHRGGEGLLNASKDPDMGHDIPTSPMAGVGPDPFDADQDPQDTTNFFEGLANSNGPGHEDENDTDSLGGVKRSDRDDTVHARSTRGSMSGDTALHGQGFFTATGAEEWNKVPLKFIREAFLIGNPLGAVEVALEAKRFCEAFILAQSIQDPVILRAVVRAYLAHVNDPFVMMLALSADQAYGDIVGSCDLSHWEEVMAFLVTYVYKPEAADTQFKELAMMLGSRLEGDSGDIRAAAVVYIMAGAFDHALRLINSMSVSTRRPGFTAMKVVVLRALDQNLQLDSTSVHKMSLFIDRLVNNGRLKLAQTVSSIVKGGISDVDSSLLKLPDLLMTPPDVNVGRPLQQQQQQQQQQHFSPMAKPYGGQQMQGLNFPPMGMTPPFNAPPSSMNPSQMGGLSGQPPSLGGGLGQPPPMGGPLGSLPPMGAPLGQPPSMGSAVGQPPAMGGSLSQSQSMSGPLGPPQPMGGPLGHPPPMGGALGQPSTLGGMSQPPPMGGMSQPPMMGSTSQPPPLSGMKQPSPIRSMNAPPPMGGMNQPPMRSQPPGMPGLGQSPVLGSSMAGMKPPTPVMNPAPHTNMGHPPLPPSMGQPHSMPPPPSSIMGQPQRPQAPSPSTGLPPPTSLTPSAPKMFNQQGPLNASSSMGAPMSQPPSMGGMSQTPMAPPALGMTGMGQPQMPTMTPPPPMSSMTQPHVGGLSHPGNSNPPFSVPPHPQSHMGGMQSSGRPGAPQANTPAPPVAPAIPGPASLTPSAQISQISTHPAASITPTLQKGLPTPWPIPTETQQKRSTTTANERINQQVQAASQPAGVVCPPQDVQRIRDSINAYMNSRGKPGEAVNNDHKTRLEELCNQLSSGRLSRECQQKVLEYATASSKGDTVGMQRAHQELTSFAWAKDTKHWLMMLKRLAMS
eukprot:Blabericola_migrator_1__1761@NODE_1476_length_4471_cov_300_611262_g379_i3_p1_GENE_NODE_1476_length_4471_cov_300_611262_g379_i3NODE_1476_length_4471_cov_300_611262_g379_i3_p1_ORF_typecomplete_len1404_score246_96Sec16_C/PF12931_7/3_5e18ANAPC4_WD40/PF12894_7/0_0031ANAPC4_WD40/PF12894_7/0_0012ANAPC4_WD40/PF12894_7/1_5e02ANAPC4_WD40/PF12894_7/5_8e03SRA1/PF07304_11/1_8e04SRA1/PF07304_11/1_8e04SRA1/PF07304_11/1_8e04SRA1/PF07304_11/0_00017Cytochrom_D1/PF02239_16/0_03Plasmid_RAQPRD/PF09686_10/36Plasmid_R